jgi:hypothetical protein
MLSTRIDFENPQVKQSHPNNPLYLVANLCKPLTIEATTTICHNLPLHDPNK